MTKSCETNLVEYLCTYGASIGPLQCSVTCESVVQEPSFHKHNLQPVMAVYSNKLDDMLGDNDRSMAYLFQSEGDEVQHGGELAEDNSLG